MTDAQPHGNKKVKKANILILVFQNRNVLIFFFFFLSLQFGESFVGLTKKGS